MRLRARGARYRNQCTVKWGGLELAHAAEYARSVFGRVAVPNIKFGRAQRDYRY